MNANSGWWRVVRRELPRVAQPFASSAWQAAGNLLALVFVVLFPPWWLGLSFLDSQVVILYTGLAIFFVAILTAYSFGGEPGRQDVRELGAAGASAWAIVAGKAGVAVVAGWGTGLVVLAAALWTVNALNWHGLPLLPRFEVIAAAAALSLAGSTLVAGGGVLISLRAATRRAAQRTLRLTLMFTMVGAFYAWHFLPGDPVRTDRELAQSCLKTALIVFLAGLGLLALGWRRVKLSNS